MFYNFSGYDVRNLNVNMGLDEIMTNADNIPDIILVNKKYEKKRRIFKLKHIDKEVETNNKKDKNQAEEEVQYEQFLNDIAEDKDMRKKINLFKDDKAIKELEGKLSNLNVNDSDTDIKVEELLDELTLNDPQQRKGSVDVLPKEEEVDTTPKLGKRTREGKNLDS